VAVVEEAIEHRGDGRGVSQQPAPVAHGAVRRDEGAGPLVPAHDELEKMEVCAEVYETFGPLMERYDAFVCPNATTTRVKAEFNHLHDRLVISGKELAPQLDVAMDHQFNMLSRCPVLAVPSGMASNGVPTGIQIVGKTFDNVTVFRGRRRSRDGPSAILGSIDPSRVVEGQECPHPLTARIPHL
jgi:Asp-tRNA(Asn)/Glu-tRNA(Gln) amidotransferase A subunit family amidase